MLLTNLLSMVPKKIWHNHGDSWTDIYTERTQMAQTLSGPGQENKTFPLVSSELEGTDYDQ